MNIKSNNENTQRIWSNIVKETLFMIIEGVRDNIITECLLNHILYISLGTAELYLHYFQLKCHSEEQLLQWENSNYLSKHNWQIINYGTCEAYLTDVAMIFVWYNWICRISYSIVHV